MVIWTRGTDKIEVFKGNIALENLTKTKALWTTRYRAWRLWKSMNVMARKEKGYSDPLLVQHPVDNGIHSCNSLQSLSLISSHIRLTLKYIPFIGNLSWPPSDSESEPSELDWPIERKSRSEALGMHKRWVVVMGCGDGLAMVIVIDHYCPAMVSYLPYLSAVSSPSILKEQFAGLIEVEDELASYTESINLREANAKLF
ncbi:hypothetical protein L211DRAFT_888531 [Terfezia boudieri ATCC MYA-4762]|uniref:Uncharacterized protein n=1 Tax=Terfezia boudieri ATCC MYA-4762 TaxID=1051890 RepID=A0A3N4LFP0_9PEZI|nr:hypothetical protein L211DRAFT_888531 [Terfezia boudieri ATCC MYA-4762]